MTGGDIVILLAVLMMMGGGLAFLIGAFRQGFLWGLGCILLPPVMVFVVLVAHWHAVKRAFFVQLAALPLLLAGYFMGTGSVGEFMMDLVFNQERALKTAISTPSDKAPGKPVPGSGSGDVTAASIRSGDWERAGGDSLAQSGSKGSTGTGQRPQPGTRTGGTPAAGPATPAPQAPPADNASLLAAVQRGDSAAVVGMLAAGADANATDKNQMTALMHAASKGNVEIVRGLLDKSAQVNAQEKNGWTALMLAASNGHEAVVRGLIPRGANLNTATSKGTTALISAVGKGHGGVVQALVEGGADLNMKDSQGRTALTYAEQGKRTQIAEILKKAGATN